MSDSHTLPPREPGSIVRVGKQEIQDEPSPVALATKEVSYKETEMLEWNTAEEREKGNTQWTHSGDAESDEWGSMAESTGRPSWSEYCRRPFEGARMREREKNIVPTKPPSSTKGVKVEEHKSLPKVVAKKKRDQDGCKEESKKPRCVGA